MSKMDLNGKRKILLVGEWRFQQYEISFSEAIEKLGHTCFKLSTYRYFEGWFSKFLLFSPFPGIQIIKLNYTIVIQALYLKVDTVFFWRPTKVLPLTVWILNKLQILTVSYNNDDPFNKAFKSNLKYMLTWFWYRRSIKHFEFNYFYRNVNCSEAKKFKIKHSDIFMPYFIPWNDRPLELTQEENKQYYCDVVFVGHFEYDLRDEYLAYLLQYSVNLKIWGGENWRESKYLREAYDVSSITRAVGRNYSKALCASKIALVFLSRLNRDTYTRRCFEIPAHKICMLAERTDDLLRLFKEDEEACFFSSKEELLLKVQWLLKNPSKRSEIAEAGYKRVYQSQHDILSRVNTLIHKCNVK